MKSCFGHLKNLSYNNITFCIPIPVGSLTSTRNHLFDAKTMPKILSLDTINPNVKTMEYAVRGPIVIRAVEIEKELSEKVLIIKNKIY